MDHAWVEYKVTIGRRTWPKYWFANDEAYIRRQVARQKGISEDEVEVKRID
ncbi:hypothetical protein GWO43_16170 [candidate division KSB1 bacterium]|nr:hypothetical protein [candidate division KSB1 bacterium]NIV68770.1 hypothetical protein [Phycisphaerae bacterium]NIS25487.1 hypothetical protein [candidate division KSB1 bacterium]NIT72380.1 hypothetical protein [candidate division KSB1 bacterium]NIU26164.1 hypothetical protein [candidate division KSB1 bacterium]